MTNLVDRLPFPPQRDESLQGLIMRLADDNLCSTREFSTWLGAVFPNLVDLDYRQAGARLGIEPSALAALNHASMATETSVGGGDLQERIAVDASAGLQTGPYMRWCPMCLAEKPYHRRMWHHRQLQVCPRHKVILSATCISCVEEGCTGVHSWMSVGVSRCAAGHALDRQPLGPSVPDCTGTAAVYRSCGVACPGPEFPPEFTALPASQLVELLLAFGRLQLVVVERNRHKLHSRDMARDHRVLEAGARIAFEWPSAFQALATDIRSIYPAVGRLSEQYGQLHRLVASCKKADFIRVAYADHLLARDDAGELDWPLFLPKPPRATGSVTRADARLLLGLGANSFGKLLKTDLWSDVEVVLSTIAGLEYSRFDVVRLRTTLDRMITPTAVDKLLGMPAGCGTALCDTGLLATVPWNRHSRNGVTTSVDTAEAKALFERICSAGSKEPPHEPVTFETLVRSAVNRQVIRLDDLMRQVAGGRPRGFLSHPGRPGFEGLVFEKVDAVRVLDELSTPEASGLILLGDLARVVRIPPAAIREMIKSKLLGSHPASRCMVFPASIVANITRRFVCGADLAELAGLAAREACDRLALSDVHAVVQVDVPGRGEAAVYLRQEVERAVKSWSVAAPLEASRSHRKITSLPPPSAPPSLLPGNLNLSLGALDTFSDATPRVE
jgi:hypothetical protein